MFHGAVGFVVTLCVFRTICIVTDTAKEEKNARNRSNSYLEQERVLYPKDNDSDPPSQNYSNQNLPSRTGLLHPYYNFIAGNRNAVNRSGLLGNFGAPPPYSTPRANTENSFEFSEAGSSFRTSNQSLLPPYRTPSSSISAIKNGNIV